MKKLFKSLLLFLLFIGIALGALYGIREPKNTLVTSVGSLQIAPTETGIVLFQNFQGPYFNFSAFNDMIIYANGKKETIITFDDTKSPKYKASIPPSLTDNISETIQYYLGTLNPHSEFQTDENISYSSIVSANRLTVKRTITGLKNTQIQYVDMSLSFNNGDFIFDQNGNLYSFVDQNTQDLFGNTFGINLTPQLNNLLVPLSNKTLYLYSPKVSAVIAIYANQNQTIIVDINAHIIRVQEPATVKDGLLESQINIAIFNSPFEILNNI